VTAMQRQKLTKRAVDACQPGSEETVIWCGETRGFGLRVYPSGRKIFFVQVRVNGRTRKDTIGPYGAFTVDQARLRAEDVIRDARRGVDPTQAKRKARSQLTVKELCEAYLEAAEAGLVLTRFKRAKSKSTVAIDRGRVSRHIAPTIGNVPASSLIQSDVQRMLDQIAKGKTAGVFKGKLRGKARVTGGPGAGARVVELLGGIYSWASARGMISSPNPAHGISTAKSQPKDRILSAQELAALGRSIDTAMTQRPAAASALKLIALTGLRRQEAVRLSWHEVDQAHSCLRLQNTKTGRSVRAIGKDALDVLVKIPRQKSDFVFPAAGGQKPSELKNAIADIFNQAGLHDARAHDLRRTFASLAADLSYSDATIGELLGHARRSVTAQHYIRRTDSVLVAAANAVAECMSRYLAGETATVIPMEQKL
jgi:integrase